MNQFINEVARQQGNPAPQQQHPRGAWSKKISSLPILIEESEPLSSKWHQETPDIKIIEKDLQANVQGKWKQRLQKSPTLEVKPLRSQITDLNTIVEKPIGSIDNIFGNDQGLKIDQKDRNKLKAAAGPTSKQPISLQQARLNKWKSNEGEKALPQDEKLNKAMSTALAIGGNHKEMLRNACKGLEGQVKDQAEVFFFEKIGAALLNNFKQNLEACRYCSRKFDVRK